MEYHHSSEYERTRMNARMKFTGLMVVVTNGEDDIDGDGGSTSLWTTVMMVLESFMLKFVGWMRAGRRSVMVMVLVVLTVDYVEG